MKSPLPKLARSIADLVGVARKGTSPAAIEAALAEARGQIEGATRDREAAETAYRDGLLDAAPAELEKRLAEKASATVRLDRAEALTAALVQRLAMARADEAHASRRALHADAVAKCEAIKARLPVEYAHHAGAIRTMLRDLAEAEVARERAGKEAADFGEIRSPEDELRHLSGYPEEIVSHETVHLWVLDGNVTPLPADRQGQVSRNPNDPDRGRLYMPGGEYVVAGAFNCTLRPFTRTRYRERIGEPRVDRLYREVALPGFGGFDDAFVTPEAIRSADSALAHLGAELRPTPALDRPIKERLELMPAVPRSEEPSNVTELRSAA